MAARPGSSRNAWIIPTAPDSDPFVLVITRLDRVIQSHKNQCLPLWIARSSRATTVKGAVIRKGRWYQMVVLREAMKVLKGELALGGAYDPDAVVKAAQDIKAHSGEALTGKFPGQVHRAALLWINY